MLLLVCCSTINMAAQEDAEDPAPVTIDQIVYTSTGNNYCTPAPAPGCKGNVVIHRLVEFGDGRSRGVYQVPESAFADNKEITSILIEECGDGYPYMKMLNIGKNAFSGCDATLWIDLPSDTRSVYHNAFPYESLQSFICRAAEPPAVSEIGDVSDYSVKGMKAVLYVNDVSIYSGGKGASVSGSFWSSFNGRIKDISEYNPSTEPDEPDPVEPTSTTLTIRVNSGSIVIPEATAGQKLIFVPDDGAALSTPEFETEIVDGNHTYTVPEKAGSVEIHPQFYDPMSSNVSVERVQPKVTVCGNRVEVSSIADGDDIVICNVNGIEIYRGSQHVHELMPGVYVISVGLYNFKLAI